MILAALLGVARNLLRRQAEAGLRRRLLADRVAAMTSPADAARPARGPGRADSGRVS